MADTLITPKLAAIIKLAATAEIYTEFLTTEAELRCMTDPEYELRAAQAKVSLLEASLELRKLG